MQKRNTEFKAKNTSFHNESWGLMTGPSQRAIYGSPDPCPSPASSKPYNANLKRRNNAENHGPVSLKNSAKSNRASTHFLMPEHDQVRGAQKISLSGIMREKPTLFTSQGHNNSKLAAPKAFNAKKSLKNCLPKVHFRENSELAEQISQTFSHSKSSANLERILSHPENSISHTSVSAINSSGRLESWCSTATERSRPLGDESLNYAYPNPNAYETKSFGGQSPTILKFRKNYPCKTQIQPREFQTQDNFFLNFKESASIKRQLSPQMKFQDDYQVRPRQMLQVRSLTEADQHILSDENSNMTLLNLTDTIPIIIFQPFIKPVQNQFSLQLVPIKNQSPEKSQLETPQEPELKEEKSATQEVEKSDSESDSEEQYSDKQLYSKQQIKKDSGISETQGSSVKSSWENDKARSKVFHRVESISFDDRNKTTCSGFSLKNHPKNFGQMMVKNTTSINENENNLDFSQVIAVGKSLLGKETEDSFGLMQLTSLLGNKEDLKKSVEEMRK